MKNAKEMVAVLAKQAAEKALRRDANRTTCNYIYQPKIPNGLSRFKKEYGCMLSTILALLLSTMGIWGMLQAEHLTMAMILLIVGCAVVFLFSPLDVPEKPLSAEDWRHYRRISRWLAAAYALLGIWAEAADWPILYPLAASAALEGILLLAGTMNQKNAHSENTE